MVTTVAIVPHTHWDREWYAPFQTFRVRLVRLLDDLVPMLERDPSYAHFLLDGQTAVLDDYLEVRPEMERRVARLAGEGRVTVGPWMILMDEFMISGETIVRDLQAGIERAEAFGGPMEVGYLPDMFGHVAQMPQILRLAGLEHAVVWRGVPSAIRSTAFWWEAPDGSRVRAEYLAASYSNGRDLPDDAKQLVGRARSFERELGDARLDGGGLLLMNGTDHQPPQPWLGRVVAEANAIQDEYRFVVTSLPAYLPTQPMEGLATWRGELRSGARANVLMGVASNRVDVHQACAAAERAVERTAEPLQALLVAPDRYAAALLREAWRQLVLNSAHDSACACSHDDVVDAVVVRYQEARHLGEALAREALHDLAGRVDAPAGSTLVVNPTARLRAGIVEGTLPGSGPVHLVAADGTRLPAQVVREHGGPGFAAEGAGDELRWVLDLMRGPELAGSRISAWERAEASDGTIAFVAREVGPGDEATDLEPLREEILAAAGDGRSVRVSVVQAPHREVVMATGPVAGFGWTTLRPVDGEGPATEVATTAHGIRNEHLEVAVDDDGTWTLATRTGMRLRGLGRLVDGGDGGDTYNWSPPALDRVVDRPIDVKVTPIERGPVRAATEIVATYRWPTHAIGDAISCSARADDEVEVDVTTRLELRHDERFVRVRTSFDNRARDHRLRAHFPLPAPVTSSHAECAFAVVERGLAAEGGPNEVGLPTFVSRRFVDASDGTVGLALVHDGLLEYEVVDAGRELALTLLRATGYLSRAGIAMRPEPAGPLDPLEGPQMQGRVAVEYAVLPHDGTWRDADLYGVADAVLVPLARVRAGGLHGPSAPATGARLRVVGAEVSAVNRDAGALCVRVFNPAATGERVEIVLDGVPARGWVVDLRGRPVADFTGGVELRPDEIATLRLREQGA